MHWRPKGRVLFQWPTVHHSHHPRHLRCRHANRRGCWLQWSGQQASRAQQRCPSSSGSWPVYLTHTASDRPMPRLVQCLWANQNHPSRHLCSDRNTIFECGVGVYSETNGERFPFGVDRAALSFRRSWCPSCSTCRPRSCSKGGRRRNLHLATCCCCPRCAAEGTCTCCCPLCECAALCTAAQSSAMLVPVTRVHAARPQPHTHTHTHTHAHATTR